MAMDMKGRFAVGTWLVAGLFGCGSDAQGQSAILNLPRASQHARVMQRIGIVDITIDYHRPLALGRKVFGGLQAYGDVWRAGANENTTIEVSDAVTVEGHPLPKGVYGLHMIPGEASWVVIFSKNSTSWGSFTYDAKEDALRVTVTPVAILHHEALSYDFEDPTDNSVVVRMQWEKEAVPFKISVDTPAIVQRSLRDQLRARAQFEWQPWMEAATYLLANRLDAAEAAEDLRKSIAIEDRFENELTLAWALGALGRTSEASAARAKGIEMATQAQVHAFGRGLQAQGLRDEALDLFRENRKKDPDSWVGHNEAARLAVAAGDFETALKEMKLAEAASPDPLRSQHTDLVRRLQHNEDINR